MNPYFSANRTEISIFDLAKLLRRKLLWILCSAAVGAFLLGAYRIYRGNNENLSDEAAQTIYEKAFTQYRTESEFFESVYHEIETAIAAQSEYLNNSMLMALDPYHVFRATAFIQVVETETGEEINAKTFALRLEQMLLNGEHLETIADELNSSPAFIKEMVGVSSSEEQELYNLLSRAEDIVAGLPRTVGDDSQYSFVLWALGEDAATATLVMDKLLSTIKSYPTDGYSIYVSNPLCEEGVEESVRKKQESAQAYAQDLMGRKYTIYPEAAKKLEQPVSASIAQPSNAFRKSIIKYTCFGFLLGMFLYCAIYVLVYVLNSGLIDYKDATTRGFHLRNLGSVQMNGVDMVTANICNNIESEKKLFVTGVGTESTFWETYGKIKEKIPEYELIGAWNALNDAKARKKLRDCDAAILLEQRKFSRYIEIKEETRYLFDADKKILGLIII